MLFNFVKLQASILTALVTLILTSSCGTLHKSKVKENQLSREDNTEKPRVIVSTDIGGTDPDDFQSMIHYLMYSDRFETEGLISSPYGKGRKTDILRMIDLYEKDLPKLKKHSSSFPSPDALRAVTKEGGNDMAPRLGWSAPNEGSEWIIKCARKESTKPLYILVWGGLEDLAQALHDAPDISAKLRVLFIGGPNKKWSIQAYNYIVQNFPSLWMIESNGTYRGWIQDNEPGSGFDNKMYYDRYIRKGGAMGADFINYYGGMIKMGDSPTVGFLLHGNHQDPSAESWGGSYVPMKQSARRIFDRQTNYEDKIPTFGMIEWVIKGPDRGAAIDTPVIWAEIDKQMIGGFYEGNGSYRIRFSPKSVGKWSYKIISNIPNLNGIQGQFTSTNPWPGENHKDNITGLKGWWTDSSNPKDYSGEHQGAGTLFKFRKDILGDWAKRWLWLAE